MSLLPDWLLRLLFLATGRCRDFRPDPDRVCRICRPRRRADSMRDA